MTSNASSSETLRVAAIQMNAGADKSVNLDRAAAFVAEAAADGNQLIVLPELFNLYGDLEQVAAQAEPLAGRTITRMGEWAQSHGVWLGGSFACRHAQYSKPVNLAVVIDPQGQVRAQYAKMHLFDIDLPGKVTSRESDYLSAGESTVCENIEWACAGLAICYDVRFPELFRQLSLRGAELLLLPSAFTRATGEHHWEVLVRARAIENQAFVVAANQVGAHAPRGASYGHSMIVDPWGAILAHADGEREGVVSATIRRTDLHCVRAQLPALSHRKLH